MLFLLVYSKNNAADENLPHRLCNIRFGTNITCGSIGSRSHMNTGDNAHGKEHGNDRGTTIADKGKCQTDDRKDTQTHSDIDDDLEQKHTGNSDTNHSVHVVTGFYTDIDAS